MIIRVASILLIVLLYGCEKPSREDCIVKVSLNWSIENEMQRTKVINEFSSIIDEYVFPDPNANLAGYVFNNEHREMYFQFSSSCDAKTNYVRNMFDEALAPILKDNSEYLVSSEPVKPGHKTIMLEGGAWRD